MLYIHRIKNMLSRNARCLIFPPLIGSDWLQLHRRAFFLFFFCYSWTDPLRPSSKFGHGVIWFCLKLWNFGQKLLFNSSVMWNYHSLTKYTWHVLFLYLVKSDLSNVRYCTNISVLFTRYQKHTPMHNWSPSIAMNTRGL